MSFFNYQQWDAIADAYIPALAILWLISAGFATANRRWSSIKDSSFILMLGLVCAYALMAIDGQLNLWPSVKITGSRLDYSTHTTVATVVLLAVLNQITSAKQALKLTLLGISFTLYLALMNYQNYHTWADMLSSLAAIILLVSTIGKLAGKPLTFLFKF